MKAIALRAPLPDQPLAPSFHDVKQRLSLFPRRILASGLFLLSAPARTVFSPDPGMTRLRGATIRAQ
jgi:hypothetical protein